MSILNVTPDSFTDGGQHDPQDVYKLDWAINSMLRDGADMIDIGGESTRPGSTALSAAEEWDRIKLAVKLSKEYADVDESTCISIDTYHSDVASAALDAGAHIINDVSGGTIEPAILNVVAERSAPIILGHIRGTPQTMTSAKHTRYEHGTLVQTVANELLERVRAAEDAGVRRWRILLDPGFGFAKNFKDDAELLRDFGLLRTCVPELRGIPWVAGLSRKRFVRRLAGLTREAESDLSEEEVKWWREKGTDGSLMAAMYGGADVVRVHDTKQGRALANVGEYVWRGRVPY
jgi:2-amino-4-hydroxy-6-hydroxymethyldihydropteridine diphosphokinase / dihydropteroate synthase